MDTTPKSKANRRILIGRDAKHELQSFGNKSPKRTFGEASSTTPKNQKMYHFDDSPLFLGASQEFNEEIDVLWDWQSPHSSQISAKRRRSTKRAIPIDSPKFPVSKPIAASQNFDKFHEELKSLKALQAQLAQPDDEDSLCVSPQQEHELKVAPCNRIEVVDDSFFNDSLDAQLLAFSQAGDGWDESVSVPSNFDSLFEGDVRANGGSNGGVFDGISDLTDDVLEQFMQDGFDDDDFDVIDFNAVERRAEAATQVGQAEEIERKRIEALQRLQANKRKLEEQIGMKNRNVTMLRDRTVSENQIQRNVIQTESGTLEFHRTKSFELNAIREKHPDALSREEIERKRLEALARRESRRQLSANHSNIQNTTTNLTFTESPIKCSPDEIEKKRLQALAKLEAKRLQSMVEKKKQEALKRLEINRLKNAGGIVKSSLAKRL